MGVFDRHDRVLDPAKYVLPKNYKPWSKIEVSKRAEVDGCGAWLVRVSQVGIQFVSEHQRQNGKVRPNRVRTIALGDWNPSDMLHNAGVVAHELCIARCKPHACRTALHVCDAIEDALDAYNKMDIANRKQSAALRASGQPIFSRPAEIDSPVPDANGLKVNKQALMNHLLRRPVQYETNRLTVS